MQYNRIKTALLAASVTLLMAGQSAMAALPADVDTAITAAQTDGLAMIGKGFAYLGAIGGLLVVLGLFYRILSKPAR